MKKTLTYLFLVLILADFCYSFFQYSNYPLDGDMAAVIVPAGRFHQVLENPLGLKVVLNDARYAGTNRFFSHFTMYHYFRSMPLFLQNLGMEPIDSVYYSCGIAKLVMMMLIAFLLASLISGRKPGISYEFLLALVLILPLFQAYGFNRTMGIIDRAVTYAFFYGLPAGLLLLFFYPFLNAYLHKKKLKVKGLGYAALIFIALYITLSSPIIAPVILIGCPVILLRIWVQKFSTVQEGSFFKRVLQAFSKIQKPILILFSIIMLLSLYSFYVGLNNAENPAKTIALGERYQLMFQGLEKIITQHYGLPLLIVFVMINSIILRLKKPNNGDTRALILGRWLLVCSLVYIFLLPLGGYRPYRPFIIRYDVIIPVTLALILYFGLTAFLIIRNHHVQVKTWYLAVLVLVLGYFAYMDNPGFTANDCERSALEQIASSRKKTVALETPCTVMTWVTYTDPKRSTLNAKLFKLWNITDEEKYYYHK